MKQSAEKVDLRKSWFEYRLSFEKGGLRFYLKSPEIEKYFSDMSRTRLAPDGTTLSLGDPVLSAMVMPPNFPLYDMRGTGSGPIYELFCRILESNWLLDAYSNNKDFMRTLFSNIDGANFPFLRAKGLGEGISFVVPFVSDRKTVDRIGERLRSVSVRIISDLIIPTSLTGTIVFGGKYIKNGSGVRSLTGQNTTAYSKAIQDIRANMGTLIRNEAGPYGNYVPSPVVIEKFKCKNPQARTWTVSDTETASVSVDATEVTND